MPSYVALEAAEAYGRLLAGEFLPKKVYLLEIHVNKKYNRIN